MYLKRLDRIRPRLRALADQLAPVVQIAFALLLLWVATQRFSLDIHVRDGGLPVQVMLTVADHNSAATYSFSLPSFAEEEHYADDGFDPELT